MTRTVPPGFVSDQAVDYIHALIMGVSGTGKTRLAGTFPGPVCIIDVDQGALTLRTMKEFEQKRADGLLYWRSKVIDANGTEHSIGIADDNEIDSWPYLLQTLNDVGKLAQAKEIRTVCLDSLTTSLMVVMRHILIMASQPHGRPKGEHWVAQQNFCLNLIQTLFKLPCHVLITTHEQYDRDEATGNLYITPNVTGQQRTTLPIHFDEVWRTRQALGENGEREFWIDFFGGDTVKGPGSRLGFFDSIGDNSFQTLMKVYREGGGVNAEAFEEEY